MFEWLTFLTGLFGGGLLTLIAILIFI
jgi:hypothetical protein